MNIAVIGAGNVGGTLADKWVKAGHTVIIGARDFNSPKLQKTLAKDSRIKYASIPKAVEESSVILISTPPHIVLDLADEMGDVSDKVIIDSTNSFRSRPDDYENAYDALKAVTGCKNMVKCFNSTGYENMEDTRYGDMRADMFMAGDSGTAKDIARQLSRDCGFANCYDFGGDDKVDLLEKFAISWINLAIFQNEGRNIAFKVIRR